MDNILDSGTFDLLPQGEIFDSGEVVDNPTGINMTNSGDLLKWVAVKGYGEDWAIYIHWAYQDINYIKKSGDKVFSPENIRKLVPCTEEVFKRYRY